jgi:hypothetical protein
LITCVNLFKIGHKLFGPKIGASTVPFFLLLPVTFDFATQARSSAIVTCLVSLIISNLILISKDSKRKSVIKSNLFFGFHSALNITSVILLPIYLFLIHVLCPKVNLAVEFRNRFFFPLLASVPLALIAKSQDKQIDWIGARHSSINQIVTIFLFPFVESENRYRNWLFVTVIFITACVLIWHSYRNSIRESERNAYKWLVLFYLLPSVTLWIISFKQPILLTRYIAYSGLAFALILGIAFEAVRFIFMRNIIFIGILSYSFLNISNIVMYRDGGYNWPSKYSTVMAGPRESILVSSPEWYTPMLSYHVTNDLQIEKVSNLKRLIIDDRSEACKSLPRKIWLIGVSDKVEAFDVKTLQNLGYKGIHSDRRTVPGVELFSLVMCNN